jgi:hypothetical protein
MYIYRISKICAQLPPGLWRNGIALDYESRDSRFDPEQARGDLIFISLLHTFFYGSDNIQQGISGRLMRGKPSKLVMRHLDF